MHINRIMFAAPKSGSGKTLITCAFLECLKKQNTDAVAFKCGPDYIDPMFHRNVQNIESYNLDTWFTDETGVGKLLVKAMKNSSDGSVAVMEGVMGLYDGVGGIYEKGSSYHLAKATGTPIVLVADVRGMGQTMVPLIKGIVDYDKEGLIKGVVLNKISESFYETMAPIVEKEVGIRVLGYFPVRKELAFDSRHLGLMLPGEIDNIAKRLETAGELIRDTVDTDEIIRIAESAPDVLEASFDKTQDAGKDDFEKACELNLAVASDEAFCFYYRENIECFTSAGVNIIYFSPLHDSCLPENIHGIILGGGYPENHLKKLCENKSMLEDIKKAIDGGVPSLAECGGFMYLHKEIKDIDGNSFNMAGVIDAVAEYTGKSVRFGYMELEAAGECGCGLILQGEKIRGHEFHYYDSSDNGNACIASKPVGGRKWECCHAGKEHLWGFPHLYYPALPDFTDRFIKAMMEYHGKREDENGILS